MKHHLGKFRSATQDGKAGLASSLCADDDLDQLRSGVESSYQNVSSPAVVVNQVAASPGKLSVAIASLKRLLPQGRVTRNVLTLGIGQIVGYGITLLAMPFLTRLYSPNDFGLFAIYTSTIAIGTVISTLRYEVAIPLAADRSQATHLLVLTLGIILTMATLCAGALLLTRETVFVYLQAVELSPFVVLLAVNLAASGCYQTFSHWLLREQQFKRLAIVRLVQSCGTVLPQLCLGIAFIGPIGLLYGNAIGYFAGSVFMAVFAYSQLRGDSVTLSGMKSVASRYRRFPQFSVWGAIVTSLGSHSPAILFAIFYSPFAAGCYLLTQRCLVLPMTLLQNPVSRVYLIEAAKLINEQPHELPRLYRRTVIKFFSIASLPLLIVMLAAPSLFTTLFGPEWSDAGMYCRILAPMLLVQLAWLSVRPTLDVIERQEMALLFSFMHVIATFLSLGIPLWFEGSVTTALLAMSSSCTAVFLLSLFITDRLVKSRSTETDRLSSTESPRKNN